MTEMDPGAWENMLIENLRANGGEVSEGPLAGHPLMIVWTTGAKTGETRRSILTYSRDGDSYVVAGTAGGSKTPPKWIANMRANPRIRVEANVQTWDADTELIEHGPERDRLWEQHVKRLPWFADYPAQTGRVIPMVRITPVA
jgi:deazaflavin-dependent oxidoreductase (nitroreductase family)